MRPMEPNTPLIALCLAEEKGAKRFDLRLHKNVVLRIVSKMLKAMVFGIKRKPN